MSTIGGNIAADYDLLDSEKKHLCSYQRSMMRVSYDYGRILVSYGLDWTASPRRSYFQSPLWSIVQNDIHSSIECFFYFHQALSTRCIWVRRSPVGLVVTAEMNCIVGVTPKYFPPDLTVRFFHAGLLQLARFQLSKIKRRWKIRRCTQDHLLMVLLLRWITPFSLQRPTAWMLRHSRSHIIINK